MSGLNDLPGLGTKFQAKVGLGSFKKKLERKILRPGRVRDYLKEHQPVGRSLVGQMAKLQTRYLRTGVGLTLKQIRNIRRQALASDPTMQNTLATRTLIEKDILKKYSKEEIRKQALDAFNKTRREKQAAPKNIALNRWRNRPATNNTNGPQTSIYNNQKTSQVFQTGNIATVRQSGDTVSVEKEAGEAGTRIMDSAANLKHNIKPLPARSGGYMLGE